MTNIAKLGLNALPELVFGSLRTLSNNVVVWNQRARQRRALTHLDAHILKDIGIDSATAMEQATRPFWKE